MTRGRLLFATTNPGKLAELRGLVGEALEVLSLADFPGVGESPEDGDTFAANAEQKALFYARAAGVPALADDSGLCVEALSGAPGVRSARYVPGTDADRWRALLTALEDVPDDRRGAAFRCALCLALPTGKTWLEEGECRGRIARQPVGEGGFGYDPVFQLPSGKTMAELTKAQKSAVSHRGEAFRRMRPHLEALAAPLR
ncbi:MAG: RdgB/HAM1 family non-canonical purine NTP pyrophosphatase [Deltaproteobacteria bacterium]|nr:RdgB/HAM1 family non-canonical purine NTP pyrophosphatase [Deltaproteobacteria bacterium]